MNKQMKVVFIVLAILSTTTIIAYAAPPTTPNMTELLQAIKSSIDGLSTQLTGHNNLLISVDGKVDTIDDRLADVPVMEFFSGHVYDFTPAVPDPTPENIFDEKIPHQTGRWVIWDSSDYDISSGAIFHVVVKGFVNDPVTNVGSVIVCTYIPYEDAGSPKVETVYVGRLELPDEHVVLEFTGRSCEIYAYVPEGATYTVYYAVSVTYVPAS